MKKVLIYVFLIILVCGSIYYYVNENDSKTINDIEENKKNNNNNNDSDITIPCISNYECKIVNDKKYYFSNIVSVNVNNMYDYVNDQMEAGYLRIDDGVLKFYDLENKVLKTYDNIENAKYIEINDKCSEKYYVVLTSDGKVYRTDKDASLFLEEPFYQIEEANNVIGISLNDGNNSCINDLTIIDKNNNIRTIGE